MTETQIDATAPLTRQVTNETQALLLAITRAERDLSEARDRLRAGQRPSTSTLGRILSQSALDVDSRSARLNLALDLAGTVMDEAALQQALAAGIRAA